MIPIALFKLCLALHLNEFNENISLEGKLVEKLKLVPTKIPTHQLLTITVYQTWY